ncbi:hypothetical protein LINGRAHAP2_LOCUS11492 [Linum grandiflorum]
MREAAMVAAGFDWVRRCCNSNSMMPSFVRFLRLIEAVRKSKSFAISSLLQSSPMECFLPWMLLDHVFELHNVNDFLELLLCHFRNPFAYAESRPRSLKLMVYINLFFVIYGGYAAECGFINSP